MTILVTAASGQLGRLVIDALLEHGADPADLVAGARDTSKIADLAARGIRTVPFDYARPDDVSAGLEGIDRVLLISGSEPGTRLAGHRNVIEAAKAARISKLVYTSVVRATTAVGFPLVDDHKATEAALVASGVPYVIARHNWYTENYAPDVSRAASTGVIASSAGDGRSASATRADYAEADALLLLDDRYLGQTLELTGDTAWSFEELAAAASEVTGRDVSYVRWTTAEHVAALEAAGLDGATAAFVAGLDDAIRRGQLAEVSPTLAELIGRPTTSLVDGLSAALEAVRAAA